MNQFLVNLFRLRQLKYVNRWVIFCLDLFLSWIASLLTLLLIKFVYESLAVTPQVLCTLSVASIVAAGISFALLKTYKNIIRHSAFTEVGRLGVASFLKSVLLCLFLGVWHFFPADIILLGGIFDFGATFFLLSFSRALMIITYRYLVYNMNPQSDKVLIYYDPQSEDTSLASLMQEQSKYKIRGFLQIGQSARYRLNGLTVYSVNSEDDFQRLFNNIPFNTLVFPSQKGVQKERDRLVLYGAHCRVKMLVLPPMDVLGKEKNRLKALPEIRIEDLLGRDEIKINLDEIRESLKGKVVMVTGAAGSIGSELCRQLCTFGLKELILFDSAETPMHNIRLELEEKFPQVHFEPVMGDIRMVHRLESVFDRFRPQYVFHAAAYKHVPLMEENPCEAVHTNVFGTRLVANMAVKYDVEKFIMISTDKAVNPTNVMGASKRLAEIYVQSLSIAISKGEMPGKTRFITTRFGNVLGSNGSVIPRFREQLAKGGPLTVTHPDIIRYFMTIPEACRLVLEAAFMGKGNEIFVFDMGSPVKIADLARRMIELSGLTVGKDIDIIYTGLRPGEKLYEELLATKENTLPTDNSQIYRAQVREYDYHQVDHAIDELTDLAIRVQKMDTVRMMKQIVPEFKSKNSIYEQLDN